MTGFDNNFFKYNPRMMFTQKNKLWEQSHLKSPQANNYNLVVLHKNPPVNLLKSSWVLEIKSEKITGKLSIQV